MMKKVLFACTFLLTATLSAYASTARQASASIPADRAAQLIEDEFFLIQWRDSDGNLWEIAGRVDEDGHGKATIAGPDGYMRNIEWSAKIPPRGSDPVSQDWLNAHPDFVAWFEQWLAANN